MEYITEDYKSLKKEAILLVIIIFSMIFLYLLITTTYLNPENKNLQILPSIYSLFGEFMLFFITCAQIRILIAILESKKLEKIINNQIKYDVIIKIRQIGIKLIKKFLIIIYMIGILLLIGMIFFYNPLNEFIIYKLYASEPFLTILLLSKPLLYYKYFTYCVWGFIITIAIGINFLYYLFIIKWRLKKFGKSYTVPNLEFKWKKIYLMLLICGTIVGVAILLFILNNVLIFVGMILIAIVPWIPIIINRFIKNNK